MPGVGGARGDPRAVRADRGPHLARALWPRPQTVVADPPRQAADQGAGGVGARPRQSPPRGRGAGAARPDEKTRDPRPLQRLRLPRDVPLRAARAVCAQGREDCVRRHPVGAALGRAGRAPPESGAPLRAGLADPADDVARRPQEHERAEAARAHLPRARRAGDAARHPPLRHFSLRALDLFNDAPSLVELALAPCCLPDMVHAKRCEIFAVGKHRFRACEVCAHGRWSKNKWVGRSGREEVRLKFGKWAGHLHAGVDEAGPENPPGGRKSLEHIRVQESWFQNEFIFCTRPFSPAPPRASPSAAMGRFRAPPPPPPRAPRRARRSSEPSGRRRRRRRGARPRWSGGAPNSRPRRRSDFRRAPPRPASLARRASRRRRRSALGWPSPRSSWRWSRRRRCGGGAFSLVIVLRT